MAPLNCCWWESWDSPENTPSPTLKTVYPRTVNYLSSNLPQCTVTSSSSSRLHRATKSWASQWRASPMERQSDIRTDSSQQPIIQYNSRPNQLKRQVINRDHNFPRNAEFWAEPRNLPNSAENTYRILQRHRAVYLPQQGFLVCISDR